MRVYVAASRQNIDIARIAMAKLRDVGHTVTHDWIADIDRNGPDDVKVTREELLRCALNDLAGVRSCDVFWLLSPEQNGSGCFFELGYAMGDGTNGCDVVISGCLTRTLFYTWIADTYGDTKLFESHDDALSHILSLETQAP